VGWIAFNSIGAAQKPICLPRSPTTLGGGCGAHRGCSVAEDDEWHVVWTELVAGARRGEMLAHRWEDVDFCADR